MSQAEATAYAKAQRQENVCHIGGTESQGWLESRVMGKEKEMKLEK